MTEDRIWADESKEVWIGGLLYLAHRRARSGTNVALAPHGIDLRHLGVLGHLAAAGPVTQRDLIDALQMDKSTMVHVIDDLERLGLAERRAAEGDRRANAIYLTPAGAERLEQAMVAAGGAMRKMLGHMSIDDREHLAELLQSFAGGPG
ncbi:MAG TPA: MarR family transcriptional regulator [Candidatus Dormibacteraeota bacterium]|jgi:DNA-binding MarR family transcriptional regulator|nr:MarR family transcriptional regulator [Candidatus Dormibacteraeota bacterium]